MHLNEGTDGNDIQVLIDHNTIDPANFNITFNYTSKDDPSDSTSETFKNVSLNPSSARFVGDAINDISQLVTVTEVPPPAPPTPPATTSGSGASAASSGSGSTGGSDSGNTGSGGSGSGSTSSSSSGGGTGSSSSTALVPATPSPRLPAVLGTTAGALTSSAFAAKDLNTLPDATHNSFMISLDGDTPSLVTLDSSAAAGTDLGAKLSDVAGRIQTAVRKLKPGLPAYRKFTCTADTTNNQLVLTSGTSDANSSVAVTKAASNSIAQELHLLDGVSKPGGNPMLTGGKADPFTTDQAFDIYFGDQLKREGIYALDEIDLFNLLCLPGVTDPGILSEAISYCQSRRAFLIADAPHDLPQGLEPCSYDQVYYWT